MESVDVHTGHLNRQSYKGIAVVCQFCEFNADRVPILTADYADDTDKRSCCPRTTRKTRSPTAQKIRKIGTQEASEGGKSGSHERIRNRREFPGFLVSRLCEFHCGRHGRPTSLCPLCLDVSLSRRKNLRQSADYRKSGILPVVIARLEAVVRESPRRRRLSSNPNAGRRSIWPPVSFIYACIERKR